MIQARCNARSPPRSTFTNRTGPVKISARMGHNSLGRACERSALFFTGFICRSEEHTSELQSRLHLVCRLLLEKKKLPPNCIAGIRFALVPLSPVSVSVL